ncbi:FAD:protein FMN transferase [Methylomarinum vadi]|uniref:FAD:protein FMN transferase n=1 Tax=Methylomarinum vadi TaxID=438855 RepID=UPI00190FBC1E|nr:FAD:protein FMN transferase [Methylomarinum vadi]
MECYEFSFSAMGSNCELKLYASNRRHAREIAQIAIDSVIRLEQRYSRYLKQNIMEDINRIANVGGIIEVDQETSALLDYADTCFNYSDGLFDITSGILRKAWDFKSRVLPKKEDVDELLTHVGWDKVSWRSPELSFQCEGMELDFGGIVKEYAADQCATKCLEGDIGHGLINLGGDIRIIGPHPSGHPWLIGIRHPRDKTNYIQRVELTQGGICSSGDYERCINIDNRYFNHILNPKTGWPVNGLASVTAIADYCLVAGSISTIAMLKEEEGKEWLQNNGLRAYWIDVDENYGYSSPDMKEQYI